MPTIKVGDKIIPHNHRTILESLEAQQVFPNFHCREGFCGVCRSRLVQGEVAYITEPLAFIRSGEFLLCVSYPVTDIEIELYL